MNANNYKQNKPKEAKGLLNNWGKKILSQYGSQ